MKSTAVEDVGLSFQNTYFAFNHKYKNSDESKNQLRYDLFGRGGSQHHFVKIFKSSLSRPCIKSSMDMNTLER